MADSRASLARYHLLTWQKHPLATKPFVLALMTMFFAPEEKLPKNKEGMLVHPLRAKIG